MGASAQIVAHVEPDRGQGAAGPRAAYQPLVAGSALRVTARVDDVGHPFGTDSFDMEFDFVDHALAVRVSDGGAATIDLRDISVAGFYQAVLDTLGSLGIEANISDGPNEVDPAIPFAEDTHTGYDPAAANAFWRQLVQADRVIGRFRAGFIGKVSPVHFFWGSFDLACTRFSGGSHPRTPVVHRTVATG